MGSLINYKTMREASFILPEFGNNGSALMDFEGELDADLVRYFGGFTGNGGYGAWKGDDGNVVYKPVETYTIAAIDTAGNRKALRDIAVKYAAAMAQEAVYVRNFNGEVTIIGKDEFPAILEASFVAPLGVAEAANDNGAESRLSA